MDDADGVIVSVLRCNYYTSSYRLREARSTFIDYTRIIVFALHVCQVRDFGNYTMHLHTSQIDFKILNSIFAE